MSLLAKRRPKQVPKEPALDSDEIAYLLRQGDLAAWSSPEAVLVALTNPDDAQAGVSRVAVAKLPAEARSLWVTVVTAWWPSCKSAGEMCQVLGELSRGSDQGSKVHRALARASCVCARAVLHLVSDQDRVEVTQLLDKVEQWARQTSGTKLDPAIHARLMALGFADYEASPDEPTGTSYALSAAGASAAATFAVTAGAAAEAAFSHARRAPADYGIHLANLVSGEVVLDEVMTFF